MNQYSEKRGQMFTFLTLSIERGFPLGKETDLGNSRDRNLINKQIATQTRHWHQIMKMGASKWILLLDKSVLLRNTIDMDTNLRKKN